MLADIVKIHCLKHQANFPMPRTSRTVVCRESSEAHTLSNNFPAEGPWVYCCNCQTFIAWDKDRSDVSLKECVFCLSSLNPRAYSCDHCAVTMVDYDDPTLRKHHAVLDWGAPQPACVGCHQFPRSTPLKHFCQTLQCEVATSRTSCSYCGASTRTTETLPSQTATAQFRAALIEAERKAQEAEERRRLAEEAVRKEIELRKQAEFKAQEIERRVTHELNQAQLTNQNSEQARHEIEAAKQIAESEARARAEAERLAQISELERQEAERRKAEAEAKAREVELKVREIEEHKRQAEEAVRRESEMRVQAEQQVREVAQSYTSKLAESQAQVEAAVKNVKKDRKAIALTAGIVVALFGALIVLIMTLITYLRS
ncbi:MAG: hypothetical protein JST85_30185 [Acidobacteria bacterium]|nr:hypothetical protein [Acidobacteriota bacterium]